MDHNFLRHLKPAVGPQLCEVSEAFLRHLKPAGPQLSEGLLNVQDHNFLRVS